MGGGMAEGSAKGFDSVVGAAQGLQRLAQIVVGVGVVRLGGDGGAVEFRRFGRLAAPTESTGEWKRKATLPITD
jgi:hypothetical protein